MPSGRPESASLAGLCPAGERALELWPAPAFAVSGSAYRDGNQQRELWCHRDPRRLVEGERNAAVDDLVVGENHVVEIVRSLYRDSVVAVPNDVVAKLHI